MDKFNSFASQAKAKAEQGRTAALGKVDSYRAGGHATSSSHDEGRPTAASPPPSRYAAPSPPNRSRANSGYTAPSSAQGTVFLGMDSGEKEAFFGLLDEYFQSRPQYRELLGGGGAAAPPAAPPRAAPTSSYTPTPAVAAAAPPRPPARTPVPRGLGVATALYDFQGENDDLGFAEGDKITVLEKVSDDWWKGELRGHTGIFPSSYVQLDS